MSSEKLSQDCQATLEINGESYEGSTGRDHGHAEMDALHLFVMSDPGGKRSVKGSIKYCAEILRDERTPKVVSCPSRPCCLKCSAVLKALGFSTAKSSSWSDKSMGSTEWGASMNVQALLAACGVDYAKITGLS